MQKKDMTPKKNVALNCYITLLCDQIQLHLTFISSLNSNHTFLVTSLETIRVVEEYLGDKDATFFYEGMHCLNISGPSVSLLLETV